LALIAPSASAQNKEIQPIVRIGLIESLFPTVDAAKDEKAMLDEMQPFTEMIQKQTQMKSEFIVIHSLPEMIKSFEDHKIQMAVLHGWEYGWLHAKVPDCEPLLIAVQDTLALKADVLVHKDNPAKSLADLKGKRLAAPKRPQPHTLFYLERKVGQKIEDYFAKQTAGNTDDAVEAVIEGKADFTVIGNAAVDVYRDRKPGRFKRLRVVEESAEFPPTVIVYDSLESNEEVMRKFRESMIAADKSAEGRQTLNLWRITNFQDVPKNYAKQVEAIVQRYPMNK
jgi:ABC-type phosphate/phosphonate transport system substrate-binding protein